MPHLERYREMNRIMVKRDDLAQYLSNAACDVCDGSRLNEISRHVRVKDKTSHKSPRCQLVMLKTISRPQS